MVCQNCKQESSETHRVRGGRVICQACAGERERATAEAQEAYERRAKADAQALADVRTLDDWAELNGYAITPHPFKRPDGKFGVMGIPEGMSDRFASETREAARAKAAAWAREVKP